jgi:glycosyltransferase involved in cell wall biosynthesis/O-antigen/teichoic acid export membrane protein
MSSPVTVPSPSPRSLRRLLPSGLRDLARGTLTLFIALSILNASNYLFHVAVSRLLGPEEYGHLAALLAVIIVMSVPLSVAQTVVAKRTARLRVEGGEADISTLAAGTTKALAIFGVAGAIVLVAIAPLLAWFLHTEAGAAVLLAPYWLVSLMLSAPLGLLQGRLRFGAFSSIAVASVAVRLFAGVGMVWAGFGVTGAIMGTVLAQVASLALALTLAGVGMAWRRVRATLSVLRGEFISTLAALSSFWLLAEIDVILARRYLDPTEAGFYASAGLLARALLFLPGAISIVALPRFAEARNGEEASRRLKLATGTIGILLLVAYPLLVLLRGPVVSLAFGEAFVPSAGLVPLLAAGMGLMALINLFVFFHVAEGTRAHRITLTAIAVEAILIAFFHNSAEQIGWIVLGVALVSAAFMYQAAIAASRWRPVIGRQAPSAIDVLDEEASVELSVVLPCHNAGRGLAEVLHTLREELAHSESWEIIVVSDGSTDETVRIAREEASENVVLLEEPLNVGKGQALRAGLSRARGRYVAFMDGDGDVDPRAIRPALALTELYKPDIVLGSKRHPLSEVRYPPLRRLMSWTYHKLCRLLFRVKVRDTQAGFKLIRRDVLATVLPRMLEKRYAFDLEFLVVARSMGYKRVFEVPIRIDYQFESQVAPSAAFRIVLDTLAIFYRRYVLGTYRPPPLAEGSASRQLTSAPTDDVPQHLRILFLNWRDIRNPGAGGAEVVTHEVSKRWVAEGHEVTLLTSRFRGSPKSETVDGVRIRRMGRLRTGTFHLRVQRELARLHGFDAVIDEVNTIPFFTPLWKRRLPPTIALIHQLAADVWDAEVPGPFAALGKRIEPRMLRLYRDVPVVTGSESSRQDLVQFGLTDVSVVHYGRDDPPDVTGEKREPSPTFLFVGRLAPNKRPDHAVEAFRHIRAAFPDARLWIVGQGPMEGKLRSNLPEGAVLLGRVSRDELYRRMARAHCLLVTSVREGWGLVVTEANSVGLPAVAYDVPGLRDSVRDGETGTLVPRDRAEELGRAAISLLNDGEYSKTRRQAAMWARQFSWDATAQQLMSRVRRRLAAAPEMDAGSQATHGTLEPEAQEAMRGA